MSTTAHYALFAATTNVVLNAIHRMTGSVGKPGAILVLMMVIVRALVMDMYGRCSKRVHIALNGACYGLFAGATGLLGGAGVYYLAQQVDSALRVQDPIDPICDPAPLSKDRVSLWTFVSGQVSTYYLRGWKKFALFLFVAAIIWEWYWRPWASARARAKSIEANMERFDDKRNSFRKLALGKVFKHTTAHSHPLCAAARTHAADWCEDLGKEMSKKTFSISMAPRELKKGGSGNHYFYFSKDLAMPAVVKDIPNDSIIKLIDVDYYVNIPALIAKMQPIIIYTFVPKTMAGVNSEYAWYVKDGQMVTQISGGASYKHELWNYDTDHVSYNFGPFWNNWRITALIEMRDTHDENRKLIFIQPMSRCWSSSSAHIPERPLERKFLDSPQTILTQTLDPPTVHMQVPTLNVNVSIPMDSFSTCVLRYRHAVTLKHPPLVSDFERVFLSVGVQQASLAAACFVNLMESGHDGHVPWTTVPKVEPTAYTPIGDLLLETPKETAETIGQSLFPTAAVPTRSQNSDFSMLKGRILDVAARDSPPLNDEDFLILEHFCARLSKDSGDTPGTIVPQLSSEVRDQQPRPTQKAGNHQVEHLVGTERKGIKTFQKSEVYAKLTAPRNIMNISSEHRIRLSSYTYALAKVFKKLKFYAFGRNPGDLAQLLCDYARSNEYLIPSDISKMDGSTNFRCEQVYAYICCFFLNEEGREDFLRLRNNEIDAPCKTATGVKFKSGNMTASGSPSTTGRNTMIVAFAMYRALYLKFHCFDIAYAKLGIFGGDDGLQGSLECEEMAKGFDHFNLAVKCEKVFGPHSINFLGRDFLDPWTTEVCIADVPRQLPKLHVSITKGLDTRVALRRKAEALEITDANTPVLRAWMRAVMRIFPKPLNEKEKTTSNNEASWFSKQEGARFKPPLANEAVPHVALRLGITATYLLEYEKELDSVFSETALLAMRPIRDVSPPVEIPCVQGGTVLRPSSTRAGKAGVPARGRELPVTSRRNESRKKDSNVNKDSKPKTRRSGTKVRAPPETGKEKT